MPPRRTPTIEGDEFAFMDAELVAFTLLETARLRCERMLDDAPDAAALGLLHREVGLAGYHTSMDFAPDARQRCLTVARSEAAAEPGANRLQVMRDMFEETLTASNAIATIQARLPSEHLSEAQEHVVSALEALDDQITLLRF